MDEWLVRFLMVVGPTTIVCGTALFGYWLKLWHEGRVQAAHRGAIAELREELDRVRQDQATQLAELHERLDFAERLLAQGRGTSFPKADTRV